jgi:DNA-binding NarL/FixJ family response regulator
LLSVGGLQDGGLTVRGRDRSVAGVRTLVVTVSPLLTDIVTTVLQRRLTLDMIGVLPTRERLAELLLELAPDLVLFGLLDTETDASARPLLVALPTARFVVLAANGQQAWLYEMRPHRTALTNFSLPALSGVLAARFKDTPPKG